MTGFGENRPVVAGFWIVSIYLSHKLVRQRLVSQVGQRYTAERDPFNKPIQTPRIKPPDYQDVAAFPKRLGFDASGW